MDKQLWQQAESRLSMYGAEGNIFCSLRFAQEKQALEGTDAITVFALLAKLQATAAKNHHFINVDGVINSSFVAWLMGATRVNPLAPHYYCPVCGKIEFAGSASSPWDLPPKKCPCGENFLRDGHDITYEGFAKYAKTRPIEVSIHVSTAFYQDAVRTIKAAFPEEHILPARIRFREGKEKETYLVGGDDLPQPDADGFWHAVLEDYLLSLQPSTRCCIDIRKSKQLDALEARWSAQTPPVISAIATPDMARTIYGRKAEEYAFITDCLQEQEAVDFDLLMQLEGFCHSTCAWRDNGEHLIRSDVATIRQLPAYRERIWQDLTTAFDGDPTGALEIMEKARMGKYCADGMPEEDRVLILAYDFPDWYPWYLSRVHYLCPKGHVVTLLQQAMLSAAAPQNQS